MGIHSEHPAATYAGFWRSGIASVYCRGLICLACGAAWHADALGVLVPAYFDPEVGGLWDSLNQAAQKVPLIAIMNPNNGPWTTPSAEYRRATGALRTAGGQVIGYVYTSYTVRPIDQVKTDIDRYDAFYAIDGIFVDEMTNDSIAAHLAYYEELYRYIKDKSRSYLVVGNPGINTLETYLVTPVTDALVTFESNTGYGQYVPDAWTRTHPSTAFSHLCYAVGAPATMTNYVQLAVARNAGYIYVTDDVANNPWDTLPTYWSAEVGLVQSINQSAASNLHPSLSISLVTNGAVQLRVMGAPGRYVLQTSTNFNGWQAITTNMTASGNFTVSSALTNQPVRFYRAQQ